jgi:predicted nucleotidyltransferase
MNAKAIKQKVVPILLKYGVIHAGLFGSVVDGTATKDSDVDILIEFPKKKRIGLLGYAHIINELEDQLKTEVDLVEYSNIKPILKDEILSHEVRII